MRVEVILPLYNEEDLLPFLLKHYAWVDQITVLFAKDSTDNSRKLLEEARNVVIFDVLEPEGIDDEIRINNINNAYKNSVSDWIIHADADEFVFVDRKYLQWIPAGYNVIDPDFVNVYKHKDEGPLDINKGIREQRRHGVHEPRNTRPVVLRGNCDLTMHIGKHGISGDVQKYPGRPMAAHWHHADYEISCKRKIAGRRERMSNNNLEKGYGFHEFKVTRESILHEHELNNNHPRVL